jgi:Flp pilus assembly protein TadG
MTRLVQRLAKDQSGAAAVEFAIVAFVFVVMAIGIVDFGRNTHQQFRLAHAADIAARVVMLDPAASDAAIAARVTASYPTLGYGDITLSVATTTVGGRSYRRLDLSRPLGFFTPGLTDRSGTIRISRLVPI